MKNEIPGYAIGIAAVLILALIGFFGYRAFNPPGAQTGVDPATMKKYREQYRNQGSGSQGQGRPSGTAPAAPPGPGQ